MGTILYVTSLVFTKLSILLFYLRLSPRRWFHTLVWILIAVVVAYVLVYDITNIFVCRPIAASWDLRLVPTAIRMDRLTKYMTLSVLNIVIDMLTLILPILIVTRLQRAFRQKISVCAVLLVFRQLRLGATHPKKNFRVGSISIDIAFH
jgi:phosphotransferase system  glucose/maltose/N-acetylglucosamine-specific IIC component